MELKADSSRNAIFKVLEEELLSRKLSKNILSKFKEFQNELNVEPANILGIVKTRWLAMHKGISRILDKWEPLSLYFQGNKK